MQPAEYPTTATDDEQPVPRRVLRWIADTMRLGGLCARTKCRCAMACRGEPRDCLSRYAPLVPEEAREAVKAMVDGLMNGVDFDTLRDECEDKIEALGEWTELVAQSRAGWNKPASASDEG